MEVESSNEFRSRRENLITWQPVQIQHINLSSVLCKLKILSTINHNNMEIIVLFSRKTADFQLKNNES